MTETQDCEGPCLTTRYPAQPAHLSAAGTGGVRSPLSSWPWPGDGLPPGSAPGIISQGQGKMICIAHKVSKPGTQKTCLNLQPNTGLLTTVVQYLGGTYLAMTSSFRVFYQVWDRYDSCATPT